MHLKKRMPATTKGRRVYSWMDVRRLATCRQSLRAEPNTPAASGWVRRLRKKTRYAHERCSATKATWWRMTCTKMWIQRNPCHSCPTTGSRTTLMAFRCCPIKTSWNWSREPSRQTNRQPTQPHAPLCRQPSWSGQSPICRERFVTGRTAGPMQPSLAFLKKKKTQSSPTADRQHRRRCQRPSQHRLTAVIWRRPLPSYGDRVGNAIPQPRLPTYLRNEP